MSTYIIHSIGEQGTQEIQTLNPDKNISNRVQCNTCTSHHSFSLPDRQPRYACAPFKCKMSPLLAPQVCCLLPSSKHSSSFSFFLVLRLVLLPPPQCLPRSYFRTCPPLCFRCSCEWPWCLRRVSHRRQQRSRTRVHPTRRG